LLKLLDSTNN